MVLPDNIEAVRSRLASRTSFFGGSISTRDHTRVASWRELPSVKAATAGTNGTRPAARLAPTPRLKLTTAAAEAAGKVTEKKKKNLDARASASKASKKSAATSTAAAVSALMQHTPPETLTKSTATLPKLELTEDNKSTKQPSVLAPTIPANKGKKMLRHQQITSVGVQTVQLLRIAASSSRTQKQGASTIEEEQQNQIPEANEKKQHCGEDEKKEAITKPLTSPRRQHATIIAPLGTKPKVKQRLKGTFYGSAQPPAARHRIRTVDDDSASDLDSFIETDDDGDGDESASSEEEEDEEGERHAACCVNDVDTRQNDEIKQKTEEEHVKDRRKKPKGWRRALKEALNGYDGSKFADIDALPDRRMHASYEEIVAEEARAGKIGRAVDRIEAEKEAAARAEERDQRRKQRRQQFIVEDDGSSSSDSGDDNNHDILSDSSSDDDDDEEEGEDTRVGDTHVRKRRKRLAGFLASF